MPGRSEYNCLRCGAVSLGAKNHSRHLGECEAMPSLRMIFEELGVTVFYGGDQCWEHDREVKATRHVPKITVEPGNPRGAHYIVAEISYGPVPNGLQVNHRCDNRRCLRPDHLYYGTPSENVEDAWRNARRTMSEDQLKAMAEGLRNSPKHKARMAEHNRALGDKQRGDAHWTHRSEDDMSRWKAAIRAARGGDAR